MRIVARLAVAFMVLAGIGAAPALAADPPAKPAARIPAAKINVQQKPATKKSDARKPAAPAKKPMSAEKAESKRNPNAPLNATKIVRPGRVPPASAPQ